MAEKGPLLQPLAALLIIKRIVILKEYELVVKVSDFFSKKKILKVNIFIEGAVYHQKYPS
jgi:hypothetical protein